MALRPTLAIATALLCLPGFALAQKAPPASSPPGTTASGAPIGNRGTVVELPPEAPQTPAPSPNTSITNPLPGTNIATTPTRDAFGNVLNSGSSTGSSASSGASRPTTCKPGAVAC